MLPVQVAGRALCLHGGGTNAAIMRLQTAKLRRELKSSFHFEYLEGTERTNTVDPEIRERFDGPFVSWYDVVHDAPEHQLYLDSLLDPTVRFEYPRVEDALMRLDEHVATSGPYDVLLGFSQGAILISLLTAMMMAEGRRPSWRSNVLVCPMPVRAHKFVPLFARPLDFPCVIAQGLEDPFYTWCRRVSEQYVEPYHIDFRGGHRFPHAIIDNKAVADAILKASAEPRDNGKRTL